MKTCTNCGHQIYVHLILKHNSGRWKGKKYQKCIVKDCKCKEFKAPKRSLLSKKEVADIARATLEETGH